MHKRLAPAAFGGLFRKSSIPFVAGPRPYLSLLLPSLLDFLLHVAGRAPFSNQASWMLMCTRAGRVSYWTLLDFTWTSPLFPKIKITLVHSSHALLVCSSLLMGRVAAVRVKIAGRMKSAAVGPCADVCTQNSIRAPPLSDHFWT
ncbi:hypothetical protein VIGAN_01158400 [Vigna angularis var. angularis]|uniref:Uncharacterized protein n=1 Tax=Vigna angularis var. angularis TaxID=157739 RepID=A0A0S3R075_PHAAN|nr:hypothetical protein VIGAN_01158400 [Vigna angularis var. angularis]